MAKNVFKAKPKMPICVTIIAPGPAGKAYWESLPNHYLAVNKAIEIPLDMDSWMVSDWWAVKVDWFHRANITAPHKNITRYFSDGLLTKVDDAEYSFPLVDGRECQQPLGSGTYEPVPGKFRPDGTVVGSAIELCARFGSREIALCGVDMFGDRYFDGTESTSVTCQHKGVWAYVPYLNSLIEWVKAQGIDIYSISPTALDVEVR